MASLETLIKAKTGGGGTEQNLETGRIYSFTENTNSTYSRQTLLSPQRASDQTSPDFEFNSRIRIPVYQERAVDFSDYIFDNS